MNLPNVTTWAGVVAVGLVVVIALIRFLLADPSKSLQAEVEGLSKALEAERVDRRSDVAALHEKLERVEALYDESRKDKHRINNELTKAQVLLGVILDLAEKCTCGALDIIDDLLRRSVGGEVES